MPRGPGIIQGGTCLRPSCRPLHARQAEVGMGQTACPTHRGGRLGPQIRFSLEAPSASG